MKIAFQGERGAFSEEATRAVFDAPDLQPVATFEDVFEAVTRGTVERAVIPIENSIFGSVGLNYDLLRAHDVQIVRELRLRIRHQLLGMAGSALDAIDVVRSHPQALGQCRRFLRTHLPDARTEAVYDTAGAARTVADTGDPAIAAIASRAAADQYALQVLRAGIEDNAENYTRFLVLAPSAMDRPAPDAEALKTSVAFGLRENVPGALFKALAVFALRELDLYKIESRPRVGQPGQYLFYLDVEGAADDDAVDRALGHLSEIATELQVLGSYPLGETIE